MNVKSNLHAILSELMAHGDKIDDRQLECFAEEIGGAQRIFAAGAGRSGLAVRAFAMRLMHLGKEVYMLGDVTTPHSQTGDLLLIGSGSGETKSLVAAAEKARACGMRIALNTIDPESALAKLADVMIVLPGASQKVGSEEQRAPSIQPMGSSYEQLSLLVYDATIMALMETSRQSNDEMFMRHANIE